MSITKRSKIVSYSAIFTPNNVNNMMQTKLGQVLKYSNGSVNNRYEGRFLFLKIAH
jgi:hypothetical protein